MNVIKYIDSNGVWGSRSSSTVLGTTASFSNCSNIIWSSIDIFNSMSGVYLSASVPVLIEEAVVPDYLSSFENQTIFVSYGESVYFYILVGNVNGTLSCEWFVNDYLYQEIFSFVSMVDEDWPYCQAWEFKPSAAGVYSFHVVIKNSMGDSSASITSSKVTVYYGVSSGDNSPGSGDNSEVMGSLETIDTNLEEVQDAVASVEQQVEELPDKIVDGMGDLMDQEQAEAEQKGESSADEVIDMIPDESQGFLDALSSLVDVLTYNGTEAVLVFPAITIPGIDGLYPEFTVLGEQRINFEEYVALLPKNWYNLSVALLDIALVLYCVKEFYGTIGQFFHGFGGMGKE